MYRIILSITLLLLSCKSLAQYESCNAQIMGLKNLKGYMFAMMKEEGLSSKSLEFCGKGKDQFLDIANIEYFCRSTKQCDFVEDYASRLVHQYGFSEGKKYVGSLQRAWTACDKDHKRCYYLDKKYLGYHELK